MTDHQAKYLEEAGQQLRRQGFTVCPEHVGLLSSGALFTPEQLAEMYRCIHETLDGPYPLTDEREKCLRSAAEQIEDTVPDLAERVEMSNQAELLADMESPAGGMMQVY